MAPSIQAMQTFWNRCKNENLNLRLDYDQHLRQAFPDQEDRTSYLKWANARARERRKAEEVRVPSGEDFLRKVERTAFNNQHSQAQLMQIIDNHLIPYCPIGHTGNTAYALDATSRLLVPSSAREESTTSGRQQHDESILGVNLNVEPVSLARDPKRRRRQQNFSEESTVSNESDDTSSPGFVFQQLGRLSFCNQGWRPGLQAGEAKKAGWTSTNFVVVVEVLSNGSAGPVWALYNFNPEFQHTGERIHVQDEDSWGWLPDSTNDSEQVSIAKIADSVSELGWGNSLRWRDKKSFEPELVPVVRTPGNVLIRQTVMPERGG